MPSFVSADARDLITKILDQDPVARLNPTQIREHPWFQTRYLPVCDSPGLLVGQTHMLYEEVILQELERKGFPRDQVVRYLDANRHNHSTTCYYLILNKRERDGQIEAGRYYSGVNFIEFHQSRGQNDSQALQRS